MDALALSDANDTLSRSTEPSLHPVDAYLGRLAPAGRLGKRRALEIVARTVAGERVTLHALPWASLRYPHVAKLTQDLTAAGYAFSTVNHALSAVRGVLKECWKLGLMSAEDYHRARAVENVRGFREKAGRQVFLAEIVALASVCRADQSPAGARDGALLAIAFTAGLRVSELATLQVGDYLPATGEVFVRFGKGNKQRRSYVATGARSAVERWTGWRETLPGWNVTPISGPFFMAVNKGGRIVGGGMTTDAIYRRFLVRCEQAGIRPATPHDARHTWIGNLFETGADVATVQRLAGHASPSTTTAYDRRPEEAKRQAVEKLYWPE